MDVWVKSYGPKMDSDFFGKKSWFQNKKWLKNLLLDYCFWWVALIE